MSLLPDPWRCRLAAVACSCVAALLWLAASAVRAADLGPGENLLVVPSAARPFLSISVRVGPPTTRFCDDWQWGGADGRCPAQVVQALGVWRAGSEVPTRLSAYLDLGDPRSAQVRWQGRGRPFTLVLQGGAGDRRWEAELAFSATGSGEHPDVTLPTGLNGRLLSRKVRFLESPAVGGEVTYYGPPR